MTYEMKLQSKYYDFIKNGTKRIELRLCDGKRNLLKIRYGVLRDKGGGIIMIYLNNTKIRSGISENH